MPCNRNNRRNKKQLHNKLKMNKSSDYKHAKFLAHYKQCNKKLKIQYAMPELEIKEKMKKK